MTANRIQDKNALRVAHSLFDECAARLCEECGGALKTGKRFCSTECWHDWMRVHRRGEGNPLWRGDEVNDITSGNDRARRWYREDQPCQECGVEKAERHHADNNPLNNDEGNIIWLCRRCHMRIDGRINRRVSGRFAPRS